MSAIVRELVTFIRFQTDTKGIKDSENAILSFRTKFALLSTGILLAANKVVGFFADVANAFVGTENVAKSTGVALNNLFGMRKAAAQFGLEGDHINQIFTKINQLSRQALAGQGELVTLAQETGIAYKNNEGQLLSNEQIFKNILEFGGQIKDEQERINFLAKLFGQDVAVGLSDLSQNFKQFQQVSDDFATKNKENIEAQAVANRELKNTMTDLSEAWTGFKNVLSQHLAPVITGILELLTKVIDIGAKVITPVVNYTKQGFNSLGRELNRDLLEDPYNEELEAFGRKVEAGTWTWWDFFGFPSAPAAMEAIGGNKQPTNITNNVEVTVPPGADLNDVQNLATTISRMVAEEINYNINQVYNNNPEVQ